MREDPKCPTCQWRLEFVRDTVYPEFDEWMARCYNRDCLSYHRHWRPSDLGWTEERAMEARR